MGALQARLVFLAFVGLSVVIAYNAVYLQDGPHPAPFSADLKSLDTARDGTTGAIRRSRRSARSSSVKAETVKSIQRQLLSLGYDPGPADGVHGFLTRAAVMAYQHDKGLQVTGEVTEGLLKQIVFGASGPRADSTVKQDVPQETVGLIKTVQQILAKMGYDPGPVDGIMGASTRQAIQKFEQEQKMSAKGRISGRLLKALVRVTGTKLATIQSG